MPKIGVLVVTYNEFEKIKLFIEGFKDIFSTENYLELLILDNNSTDDTLNRIKLLFPDINIILLNDNYGCVTGRNIGIVELHRMGCNYIYISDNDIKFEDSSFFRKLYEFLQENPSIDGCCPIVKNGSDESIQSLGSRIKLGYGRNQKVIDNNTKIDILPGCAQFFPMKTFINYGLFDNDLSPISIEDYEWGFRNKNKVNLKYLPTVSVLHFHDGHKYSSNKQKNTIIGRVVFIRKHFTLSQFLREIIYLLTTIFDYGLKFTVYNYYLGFKKKLYKKNYDFENFSKYKFDKYSNASEEIVR